MSNSTRLSTAQTFIVDLAIASLQFLKDAATEYKCSIDDLDEEKLRDFAISQRKKK